MIWALLAVAVAVVPPHHSLRPVPLDSPVTDTERFLKWADHQQPLETVPGEAAGYRFSASLFGQIARGVRAAPQVVTVEEIGRSWADRPLWAMHIDGGGDIHTKVLVFANMHAMEWMGAEVATALIEETSAHPVPGVWLTVIPVLNPDGRAKVEADLLAGRNAYRRGNLKNVDLNRDWAVNRESEAIWEAIIPAYYGHTDAPLSQPETRAIDRLAARERYHRAASLHAFGGFFYYPWAGRFERVPLDDREEFVRLGRAMEAAQGPRAYKTRQLARWGFFFRALGAEIDHLYGEYGTHAFLIELTRSGVNPLRKGDWKNRFRWYNPRKPRRHVEKGLAAVRALVRVR